MSNWSSTIPYDRLLKFMNIKEKFCCRGFARCSSMSARAISEASGKRLLQDQLEPNCGLGQCR